MSGYGVEFRVLSLAGQRKLKGSSEGMGLRRQA
jgi:hypothetical protein